MADPARTRSLAATRTLGAIALLAVGAIHYQQYRYAFYSAIPTIGPLFLANFVGATALGLILLAPGKSRLGRLGGLLEQLAALGGVGLAATGLVALLISEHTPLFGFMERGYRFVIVLTITSEAVAIVMLTLFLVRGRAHAPGRGAAIPHGRSGPPPTGQAVAQRPVSPVGEDSGLERKGGEVEVGGRLDRGDQLVGEVAGAGTVTGGGAQGGAQTTGSSGKPW